jgi:hypothetical protein
MIVNEPLARVAPSRLDVGNCDTLHIGVSEHRLQVIDASRPDSDHSQPDPFARCGRTAAAKNLTGDDRRHRDSRTNSCRSPQELAPS